MRPSYTDIRRLLADQRPHWHDEHGTPRYVPHAPQLCPEIYATEVALLRIACQACRTEFDVQMSSGLGAKVEAHVATTLTRVGDAILALVPDSDARDQIARDWDRVRRDHAPSRYHLADEIRAGRIHYGDPPNVRCCPAGPTMNCLDLRVLEYWARDDARPDFDPASPDPARRGWRRFPDLEIALPDEGP